jgi:hypothetical protein
MVKCGFCGKEFVKISPSHTNKHGLTLKEYQDRFGKEDTIHKVEIVKTIVGSTTKPFVGKLKYQI